MDENMVKFMEKLKELIPYAKRKKGVLEVQEINDFFGEIERIEARLPLLRWRSGGDHNNIGVAAVLVIADGNLYVASQIVDTITQVHHLAVCALLIDVDQQNFVADALCQQAERGGRSD